jgi:hypothetical protein
MKPLLNQRDLKAAFNKGYTEEVAKDLNLYQTIETDKEWEDDRGHLRKKTYLVKHSKGFARWHVKQLNGQVISVGCVWNVDLTKPHYTA